MLRRHTAFVAWVCYVGFVIYGSLVPLRPRALSLDAAREAFRHTPYLALDLEARADWIANGVLYVPVGLLALLALVETFSSGSAARSALRWAWAPVALALSLLLAVGVEFAQLWFPPRSVTLNDLLAEAIGSTLGVALAAGCAGWLGTLRRAVLERGRGSAERLLGAYVLAYLALALFPYDLLLTADEIAQKAASDSLGWLLAGPLDRPFLSLVRLGAEWLATLPVGCWLAARAPARRPAAGVPARVIVLGLLFGAAVEAAQFFVATGTSQGASLLVRAAGVACGWLLWRRPAALRPAAAALWLRRYAWPLALGYVALLAVLSGWASAPWGGLDVAARAWERLDLLPFYYHYYTTEARAVSSLVRVLFAYAPVGVLAWAHGRGALAAAAWAGALALAIEAGKLFLPSGHADPTAVLLATASAWATVRLLAFAARSVDGTAAARGAAGSRAMPAAVDAGTTARGELAPEPASAAGAAAAGRVPTPARPAAALAAAAVALGAWGAIGFPWHPGLLLVGLAACALLVWQRPLRLAVILLAALPALDLAPWSGRSFFDEFDLLLLVGFGVAFLRTPRPPAVGRARLVVPAAFAAVAALLALSWAVAAVRGLLPWQWPDANSFSGPHSPWNALRIAKGAFWAWLACVWLQRQVAAGVDVRPAITRGMTWGLALAVGAVVWERAAFVGLLDFADTYRVTGLFSAMHTGGAYIECYLAMAAPFAVLAVLQARALAVRLLAAALLLATAYAVMVTFSRNGYLAFAAGLALVAAVSLRTPGTGGRLRRGLTLAGLAGGVLAVALPVFLGDFAQQRMAQARDDLAVREAHWADALALRDDGLATTLLGMGVGRFPEAHFWGSREPVRAALHRLEGDGAERHLRLGPGSPLYVEQIVELPASDAPLDLELRLRSPQAGARLTVALCEKWMLTSRRCHSVAVPAGPQPGEWTTAQLALPVEGLAARPWPLRPTVKLSLLNETAGAPVDVDGLRLHSPSDGTDLLANGDFARGMDRWFWSVDVDPPWHIHSLPVSVLFDQGVLGLAATAAFLVVALGLGLRASLAGSAWAGAATASLAAFVVCGALNTLVDAPRILFLMLMVAWCCAVPARDAVAVPAQRLPSLRRGRTRGLARA